MTHIENLRVGQWVAITRSVEEHVTAFGTCTHHDEMVSGRPLKILAISLPFVVVTDGDDLFGPIDTRLCEFTRLSRSYVRCLVAGSSATILQRQKEHDAQSTDARNCPMCNSRLRERRIENGIWELVCPECGFTGGLPPIGAPYPT